MDFELSADQQLLADTVASFVKRELPVERARRLREDRVGWSAATWKQMGELGWLGVMHPEQEGGLGGPFVDAAIILERLGTALVSEPYAASAVVAASVLHAASEEQQARWLAPMIAGQTSLALAWAEKGGRYDPAACATRADKSGGGYRIRGDKVWVDNGHAADCIIVSATSPQGVSLFAIDASAEGLRKKVVQRMDGHKAAMLSFDCAVDASALIDAEGGGAPWLARALDYGAAAACAEGYGVMKTALAMTVEYLKTREQFGVKIGAFQALQHRAVDMFIETELVRSVSLMAAIKADDADPAERQRAISAAKAQLALSGRFVTQQAIQLHGGIGITDEHDIGLYFKRMRALEALYGDEEHHVARFAGLKGFA